MEIRSATHADIPLLVRLIRRSFADVAQRLNLNETDHPKSTSFYTEDRMKEDFKKGIQFFILYQNHQPAGCVAMERTNDQTCYLMRLSVLPDYRKTGLGIHLVNHVCEQAKTDGFKQISIGIVATANRLKQWYEKQGFVEVETKKFDHLPFLVAFLKKDIS